MLTCWECKEPITESEPHFWGRHGGEWHPRCYAELQKKYRLNIVVGMWMNTDETPKEYMLEMRGLEQGSGI